MARRPPYHGLGAGRVLLAGALLLFAAGCSTTLPIASLIRGNEAAGGASDTGGEDATGTLSTQPDGTIAAMPAQDWQLAKLALREALARRDDAASIPWQNSVTGAHGTVTPIASAYVQDGTDCRSFLASRVHPSGERWVEGTACRSARNEWEVKTVRLLRKS